MITSKTITNNINRQETLMSKSISNMSSGTITTADNPSGSAIASKMEAQINGIDRATQNAQDGISLLQTADGALSKVQSMLQRMNELATSAANGTMADVDREAANIEFQELKSGISQILKDTEFNNKSLFTSNSIDGSNNVVLQVGANSNQTMIIDLGTMDLIFLGLEDLDISTQDGASKALDAVKDSIKSVSSKRSYFGAYENRLEHTISNLDNYSENLSNAKSRITDVDMAKEMVEYTKQNLLAQTNINLLQMYLDVRESNAKALLSSFL